MGLFDRLRDSVEHPSPDRSGDAPTLPSIPVTSTKSTTPGDETYDPTQPNQAPVAGIDLPTFADLTRQLMDSPPDAHAALLLPHGHTPESWNAVNTAWIARLGQMPFLHDTYNAAYSAS